MARFAGCSIGVPTAKPPGFSVSTLTPRAIPRPCNGMSGSRSSYRRHVCIRLKAADGIISFNTIKACAAPPARSSVASIRAVMAGISFGGRRMSCSIEHRFMPARLYPIGLSRRSILSRCIPFLITLRRSALRMHRAGWKASCENQRRHERVNATPLRSGVPAGLAKWF